MSTENIKTSLGNNEENNESFVDPSVIDFKRRLESFSIDLDLSKFGHIDSDEHGEAGEISLGAREVIDDNVNELNIQLSSQRSKLFNKSESPYFSESSERPLKMSEVNKRSTIDS